MEGLKNAKPYIRRMLASSVNLRNTPELTFVLDQSIEYGVHMTGLIDAVANELAAKEPAESSEGKGGISDGKTPERHNRDAACGVCKC